MGTKKKFFFFQYLDTNKKERLIITTGGDDNACSVAYIDIIKNSQHQLIVEKYEKFTEEFAHASALTGKRKTIINI